MKCERRGEVCERCKKHIKHEEHICEKEQARLGDGKSEHERRGKEAEKP